MRQVTVRQATSHYFSQCWYRSMSPYDVTRAPKSNSLRLRPYITTAARRYRKPFNRWQCSFHLKAVLPLVKRFRQRQIAVTIQRSNEAPGIWNYSAPGHYFNRYKLIVKWNLKNELQWNLHKTRNVCLKNINLSSAKCNLFWSDQSVLTLSSLEQGRDK